MARQGLVIKPGDTIAVRARGITVRGKVHSAYNYGATEWEPDDNWYIEITDANVPGGYSYWKQGEDKGWVVSHNGNAVGIDGYIVPDGGSATDGGTSEE